MSIKAQTDEGAAAMNRDRQEADLKLFINHHSFTFVALREFSAELSLVVRTCADLTHATYHGDSSGADRLHLYSSNSHHT